MAARALAHQAEAITADGAVKQLLAVHVCTAAIAAEQCHAMAVPLTDASCESGSGSSCAGSPSALASSWSSRGAAEQAMAVCAVQGNI